MKKRNISGAWIFLLLLAGIAILLYPSISSLVNKLNGSHAVQQLTQQLEDQNQSALDRHRKMAESYNNSLRGGEPCPHAYDDILDFGSGILGSIEIPAIHVNLPIYHGIDDTVLAKGVGHMPGTAFPIGGEGNHTVLTGHTGLPSAELFTGLDRLSEGDLFYISILGQTLAYEVDSIQTVLPEETHSLQSIPGGDYCTLVTCTPYGINSHRLLVRGRRIS